MFISTQELLQIFEKNPIISTDTRQITGGCLFFALKGDNFDGNQFAAQALAQGAAYAIVDDPKVATDARFLLVENVLKALQDLGNAYRKTFEIPVIGITGSNGKTTTKELVAAVMNSHYNTHFTRGNFNNHIGVPLTLLAMPRATEVAIIEMGANHQGEIDELCQIAAPTHGLITNVGKAHLEGFGGFEGVKKGKSEMYRYLASHRKTIFINEDEPFLSELAPEHANRIFYKKSDSPNVDIPQYELQLLSIEPFLQVSFLGDLGEQVTINSNLVGEYNFGNIATAVALGRYFKVPSEKIKQAIEAYVPSNNRSEIKHFHGAKIILDAYNANPSSVRGAVLNFSKMDFGASHQEKIIVLGDMRELGTESFEEHLRIFELCKTLKINKLVFVGSEFGKIVAHTGGGASVTHFADTNAARAWFGALAYEGKAFLIKGSRGMKLETLLN
jgi:UDP-N-acetylmuramoyl-tripeptide--D-alanyl-D-alanine ligase